MTFLTKALKNIGKQIRRYNDAQEKEKPIPKHEMYGNRSERISVIVNSILAAFTLVAIWLTFKANQTSIDALSYAKHKDSLDNIEQGKRDKVAEIERIANRTYVDSTLAISTQSVDAAKKSSQIAEKALNETKRSYEFSREAAIKEIRAYVVLDIINLKNFSPDSLIWAEISFTNVGKSPAYNVKASATIAFGKTRDNKYIDEIVKNANDVVRDTLPIQCCKLIYASWSNRYIVTCATNRGVENFRNYKYCLLQFGPGKQ